MYLELGVGWMFTTLGLISLLLAPIPVYFNRAGKTKPLGNDKEASNRESVVCKSEV